MAGALSMQGIAIEKTHWLQEGAACELVVMSSAAETSASGSLGKLGMTVNDALRGMPFDAIVQPHPRPRYKLFVADMESTIIENECLDELAEYVGLKDKIAAITRRAMNGELDFEAALAERVGLLAGLPEAALQDVYDKKVTLMPGAQALLAALKKQGVHTMLVSGGFTFYTERIKARFGFDEAHGNRLEIKDGKLTGRVIAPILGKEAKLQALLETCKKLGISTQEALAIGDGANDLPMLLSAGLGVAYRAKPVVRAQAAAQINHCDLSALIWLLGSSDHPII